MKRKRETVPLSELLTELMAGAKYRQGPKVGAAREVLGRTLGPGVAEGVEVHGVKSGSLDVSAPSPAQVQELRLAAPGLVRALAAEGIRIHEIRVRLRS